MTLHSRRNFIKSVVAVGSSFAIAQRSAISAAADQPPTMTFGFGAYGMQSLTTHEAIVALVEIGYDSIELCVRPEWDAAPERMSAERRAAVRRLLDEKGLRLTALMEHLQPAADATAGAANVERLRRAAELGRELSPKAAPVIQTTLGGGQWEAVKSLYRDRLGDWLSACKEFSVVLAVKPHRGGAMSRPQEANWLIEQLGEPQRLRMVYDYSHYAFRDMPLEETVRTAAPNIAHVAVKDAVMRDNRVAFELPGASGEFDYAALLRLLADAGYRGDVSCEVSGMVWNRPDYNPIAAAKTCYQNLAPAFQQAGVRRS